MKMLSTKSAKRTWESLNKFHSGIQFIQRVPHAFSLVELLAVMAVMGVLTAASTVAISSMSKAGNMNQTASSISLLLEQARAHAMANNTYVWVGFAQNAITSNLTIGVVAGTTGQQSDLTNAKYIPLFAPKTYNLISLKSGLSVASLTQSGDQGSDISTSTLANFQQRTDGTTITLSSVIQYNPRGQACLASSGGASHGIQIGLQPNHGGGGDIAILQIATLTGQVQVFRPL